MRPSEAADSMDRESTMRPGAVLESIAMVALACASAILAGEAAGAKSSDFIEVTGPPIIGFYPPPSDPTREDDDGYAEGYAHLRFGIEDTMARSPSH
jgi:hypothetical protein